MKSFNERFFSLAWTILFCHHPTWEQSLSLFQISNYLFYFYTCNLSLCSISVLATQISLSFTIEMNSRFKVIRVSNEGGEGAGAEAKMELQSENHVQQMHEDPKQHETSPNLTTHSSLPIRFSVAAANTQERATNSFDRQSIAAQGSRIKQFFKACIRTWTRCTWAGYAGAGRPNSGRLNLWGLAWPTNILSLPFCLKIFRGLDPGPS